MKNFFKIFKSEFIISLFFSLLCSAWVTGVHSASAHIDFSIIMFLSLSGLLYLLFIGVTIFIYWNTRHLLRKDIIRNIKKDHPDIYSDAVTKGKSEIARKVAENAGIPVIDLPWPSEPLGDLNGLPKTEVLESQADPSNDISVPDILIQAAEKQGHKIEEIPMDSDILDNYDLPEGTRIAALDPSRDECISEELKKLPDEWDPNLLGIAPPLTKEEEISEVDESVETIKKHKNKKLVLISVSSGVAKVIAAAEDVEVIIRDYDEDPEAPDFTEVDIQEAKES